MAIQERSALKNSFKTGTKPTQQNFADLFDSYWHMNDGVATQTWVQSSAIQVNPSLKQDAGFNISGAGRMGELMLDNGNISQPDILHFGTSGLASIYRNAGGLDMNYTGYYHNFSGLSLRLPNTTTDPAYGPGAMFFNPSTGKMRSSDGGSWANLATEDWVRAGTIQANAATAQPVGFYLTGTGSFIGNYTGGLSIKYDYEGQPFSWAWYHNITPSGHFSGVNNGGSGTPGPSVYPAANSYIDARISSQNALDFYANNIKPYNLGLRNGYENIGYEAINFASNAYYIAKLGGFFGAINQQGSNRGVCYMVGSEHVVKNTDATLASDNMQMVGMRAIADLNIDAGNGMLAAGYFKATNAGTARVSAIYSDGGRNYLKDGVETDAPSDNGAGTWKLGKLMSGDRGSQWLPFVEVSIDGQLVRLPVMQ